MAFNENTRVKIPAILHLRRLGYQYISLLNAKRDENTNIFTGLFSESLIRINKDIDTGEIKKVANTLQIASFKSTLTK